MRKKALVLALSFGLLPLISRAQQSSASLPSITHDDVYCSGMFTTAHVSEKTQIVSGEDALYKVTFSEGDYIYLNRGSRDGVKPGDEFLVMRPEENDTYTWWFAAEPGLAHSMGQMWEDVGQVKVVVAQPKISVAQVTHSCSYMQRGDVVQPYAARPVPELKSEVNFDRFAPPSGKKKGVVVAGKAYRIEAGTNDIVYVNLGSKKGVQVGDYVRIFRYQSNGGDLVYQTPDMATSIYGFGSGPSVSAKDMPRQVLGEGIVLRVSPNSATVLITYSLQQIYEGDYCEVE
ncbi:MAG TPA: hypothetical protein VFU57_03900 [Candidatus Acidoferrales bacterium]|nr:hypothetical protein [Candidatus Acidoferrales bacterium]